MHFLSFEDSFQLKLKTNSSKNIIRVSNGLDPDQEQRSVAPGLGPKCLLRLSADDKSHR